MARTESINVLLSDSGKALLDEQYGFLLKDLERECISSRVKNSNLSIDPESGSIEVDRYYKLGVDTYGTARSAGAGSAAQTDPFIININQRKEIIPEFEQGDIDAKASLKKFLNGVREKQAKSMARHLDTAFWAAAKSGGTQFKPLSTISGIDKQFDAAVVQLQGLNDNYVDGVNLEDMFAIFDNATFMELKEEIDEKQNPNTNTAEGKIYSFHGVECDSTHRLPSGVKFILMVKDYSVAQPVKVWYKDFFTPQYSNGVAMPLFFHYGTANVNAGASLWFDGTTVDPTNSSNRTSRNK